MKVVGDIHRTLFEFVDPRNLKKFVSEIVEEELSKLEKMVILELRELREYVAKKRPADADADSTSSKVAKSSKQVEIEGLACRGMTSYKHLDPSPCRGMPDGSGARRGPCRVRGNRTGVHVWTTRPSEWPVALA